MNINLITYIVSDWKGKIKMRKLYKSDYIFGMLLGFATATVVSGYFNTPYTLIFGCLTVACVVILTWLENE